MKHMVNNEEPVKEFTELDLLGGWPVRIRNFVIRQIEFLFVFIIAILVVALFYLFPFKFAFLNLFYLPVLVAAYFLGKRKALLAGIHIIILVSVTAFVRPEWFSMGGTTFSTMMMISIWVGFLVITSLGVGALQERLAKGFEETRRLYEELKRSRTVEEMKEKVEKALYATMDPVVAKLATEEKLRFEKREISIMFTDLTDFTSYSEQHPADVVLDELNLFLGHMEPVIELFHGHIDKYMGDGTMLEFGAPIDYDQHALMAVVAGLKMQEKVKLLTLPWRLRIGVATGNAIIGMLGSRRKAYSAIGDSVNIAKRLEEICKPGKVFINEATYQAIKPFITATRLKNMGYSRESDKRLLEKLQELEDLLEKEGDNAELLYQIGKIYYDLRDASEAINFFERSLALNPESTEVRLAYADASLKKDEFEKIQLKGMLTKIIVYEVVGIKSRWYNPDIIPPYLSEKYKHLDESHDIPVDLVLSAETLDGSIGHGQLVALLSYAIAEQMNLNEELKKTIFKAGYLQDIGKQAIPHHILNRSSSLSDQEVKIIEKYPLESVAILKRLGYVEPELLEIVKHHRELWRGNGQPDGLQGEAIPLGARITCVAEAYSGMTAWRPYHDPWDSRLALSELRKGVEKGLYDPNVVGIVTDILKRTS
jgi:HD-GYP domain-containing protein (c-di-GMP phosphodiesterase class II)